MSLDRSQNAEPSPAREALKANLGVPDTDSTLSLRKRKSWIGSIRDVFQKSALQAKAAVDSFRSDQGKEQDNKPHDTIEPDPHPRDSIDSITRSIASTSTPLSSRRGRHERHNSLMSRVATASLRNHLPGHSSRHKRRSVLSIAGRPSSEMSLAGPETFASPSSQESNATTHGRKSSVASIVGSIRGLKHRPGKTDNTPLPRKQTQLDKPAENVPLPSSPINIPSVAPALELNFAPTGLISPTFELYSERQQAEELSKLTNAANITTGVPTTDPVYLPELTPIHIRRTASNRPNTPSDLLKISVDDLGPSPSPAPATPMPGTNFSLEVDGANSEKTQRSQVFERGVATPNEKERRELRTMRSLGAMAEACTIAHANDEHAQLAELPAEPAVVEIGGPHSSPNLKTSSTVKRQTPHRNLSSAETVHSCPSDMLEITRQESVYGREHYQTPTFGHKVEDREERTSDDPFDDRHAVYSGPPSPIQNVELPFRPKVKVKDTDRPTETGTGGASPGCRRPEGTSKSAPKPLPSRASSTSSFEAILQLRGKLPFIAALLQEEERLSTEDPFKEAEQSEHTLTAGDDTHTRSKDSFDSDIVEPLNDNDESPFADGMSPHGGPLVPQIYHRINNSQNGSPSSVRALTTYIAGLGDTEHRFSFDNWLNTSSNASAPDNELATPNRRRMDMSLDSVSTTGERKTPAISPTTTSPDRTPSMGNKLEFDTKRSERNMRYNALNEQMVAERPDYWMAKHHAPPRFFVGGSEDNEGMELKLADFENTYPESNEASPQSAKKRLQARVSSEDSVADSLKNAAHDYSQLEERLGENSAAEDVLADPVEAKRNASFYELSEKGSGLLTVDHARTSGSPSTRKKNGQDQAKEPPSFGLKYRDFTPTPPRDKNEASIRLKGLTIRNAPQSTPSPVHTEPNLDAAPMSSSSIDSPFTFVNWADKNRVSSSDTLDRSLEIFSSPDSGYQADKSSMSPGGSSVSKSLPWRYRSKSKRKVGSPLGEISRNVV